MKTAIRISGLCKDFDKFRAVDGIDLELFQNVIFGILGPNGAGKTTSILMLCGLLAPSAGQISFPAWPGKDRADLIGYCPQENIHYPKLTCQEQLRFYASMHGISAINAKERASELLDMLGLTTKSNVIASKLSGGMKRRLNIALALIHNPPILVLDEPEAGLDPQSRILVREVIRELGKGRTVILSTHNMDEADRLSDRIGIIDKGKMLMTGSPEELKNSIGEGDILEVIRDVPVEENFGVPKISSESNLSITYTDDRLFIKGKHLAARMSEILELLKNSHVEIKEIRLRQNTLEDVFIHLTGKELRS